MTSRLPAAKELFVRMVRNEHFGNFAALHKFAGDAIVVCGWKSPGPLKPLSVMLSHQLYEEDIDRLLLEWEEVWVIPYQKKLMVAKRAT
jgi:hypothetical protein